MSGGERPAGEKPRREKHAGEKQAREKQAREKQAGDAASMWESLSRGEDPTAAGPERASEPELLSGRDARGNNGNTGTGTVAEPGHGAVSAAER
jgi:hypothetical protein